MKKEKLKILVMILCFTGVLQSQVKMEYSVNMEVDSRYDTLANPEMEKKMNEYKAILEKEVSRIIGKSDIQMLSKAPESLLSNFLSDQLLAKANELSKEPVDLAIINLGGIRAPLNEGNVTIASIYRIMPFENELVFLKLKGKDLREIFENIAGSGGEGVSNVKLEIFQDKISSLTIGGKQLVDDGVYIVATMDYLAEGNSGMTSFLKAIERYNTGIRIRDVYIEQIEKITAGGETLNSSLDGRIKIL